MADILAQTWLVDELGAPTMHVAKDEAFDIVVVTPRPSGDVPDHIWVTVSVGDESKPISVPWSGQSGEIVQYRLQGQRLDDDEAFFDSSEHDFSVENGETLSVTADGIQPFLGFAYQVKAARDTSIATEHLTQAFENWHVFHQALLALPEQTEATKKAITMASGYLQMLSLGLGQMRLFLDGDTYDKQGRARAVALHLVNLIPADPSVALENDTGAYIGGYWSGARFLSDMRTAISTYEDKIDDQFAHTIAVATIGSYKGFAQYSGGDMFFAGLTNVYEKYAAYEDGDEEWYERTGIDEMGKAKTLSALLAEMALEKLIEKGFETGVRVATGEVKLDVELNLGRGRGRSAPDTPSTSPATRGSTGPPVPGRIVDPSTQGIRADAIPVFLDVARRYGVVISLRAGNQDSMVWQALGLSVKSTELKTKTVQNVDLFIGGPARSGVDGGPESPVGLVGVFDPRLPSRPDGLTDSQWDLITNGGRRPPEMTDDIEWTEFKNAWADDVSSLLDGWRPEGVPAGVVDQVVGRFIQRRLEFADNMPGLHKLEEQGLIRIEDGLIIDTGLYRNTNKPITGDYDLFDIHRLDGQQLDHATYREIVEELGLDPDALVVHGAHARWRDDAPFPPGSKEEAIFNAINRKHQTEELMLIGGFADGLIRTSYTTQVGDDFPLIVLRDGRVMWSGGFINRPTPLQLLAHKGPLSLDTLSRSQTLVGMVPISFLRDREQAPGAPSDESSEAQAKSEAARRAQQEHVDKMIAVADDPDLKPEFHGPEGLWATPEESDETGSKPDEDIPLAVMDEPWLQPGGSDDYLHPEIDLIESLAKEAPLADEGLASSVARVEAGLRVLKEDKNRLEFILREYGPRDDVSAALDTVQTLLTQQQQTLDEARDALAYSREEVLSAALYRDTPAPIEDEPWLQPGGSDAYQNPDHDLIRSFVPFVPYGGDGLASSIGQVAAGLEILNRDEKRLEFLQREYGLHPAVDEALDTVRGLKTQQGKLLGLVRKTLQLSVQQSRDEVDTVLDPLAEPLADALSAPTEPGFEHMSDPMRSDSQIHPFDPEEEKKRRGLLAIAGVVLALLVGITVTRGSESPEDSVAQEQSNNAVSDNGDARQADQGAEELVGSIDEADEAISDAVQSGDERWQISPDLQSAMYSIRVKALSGQTDVGPNGLWSVEGTASGIGDENDGVDGANIEASSSGVTTGTKEQVDPRDNNSTHPCGAVNEEFRVTCPLAAGPMPVGEHIVVAVELDQIGPREGSTFTHGLAFDDDGDSSDNYQSGGAFNWDFFIDTEFWYRLEIGPTGERRVWAEIAQPGAIRPRHSSASVIEHGRFLIWIIPRNEVPGDQLAFRATAFRNDGPSGQQPVPESSGGDVSGENPLSELTPIDVETVIPLDPTLSSAIDYGPAPVPRVDPGPNPEATLWAAFAAEFAERVTTSLGDEDALFSLIHPGAVAAFGGEDACRELIRTTVGQAVSYRITGAPQPAGLDGLVAYTVPVEYEYPTGAVPSQDLLASTGDGRVAWVFSCAG